MGIDAAVSDSRRKCPLCGGNPYRTVFPYATLYDGVTFSYIECDSCRCVYVDPVPGIKTLSQMYAKSDYHDHHYAKVDLSSYEKSASLLLGYADSGASVLDYGSGSGAFLTALTNAGFMAYGVEFNKEAAMHSAVNSKCTVFDLTEFEKLSDELKFDVIHFGDVLEHLPDPYNAIADVLKLLNPGGIIFIEGPLETNPSPVYFSSKIYGMVKHFLFPKRKANCPPTHLFRCNSKQQLAFFARFKSCMAIKHFQVYETGWPYASGGIIKKSISEIAIAISKITILNNVYGNRFEAILLHETYE